MPITEFFNLSENMGETHNWAVVSHKRENVTLGRLAKAIATAIVEFRCRRCPHHFQAWANKAEKGLPLVESSSAALKAFLTPTFGEPGSKNNKGQTDQLEGFVSEWIWYFITSENPTNQIVYQIPPGFKSIDPGGDGFIIHRLSSGTLMYRLWEMKKFAPTSDDTTQRISSTIERAYSQLNSNAMEYLARITTTEQETVNPELEEFLGLLPDLWVDASPQAAAGVSIATSFKYVESNCFDNFGARFPRFTQPVRLRGMITGVLDFSKLSLLIQEYIWKGL
ncbi:MAG TPA: hypothetical protein PKD23_11310 [Bellilinea sp.]|nr:hypothetical protein [Bellilinea sp.]